MAKSIIFSLVSNNMTLILGSENRSDFGVLDYSGIEASEYSISWQSNAQLDGGIVAGRKVEPRPIGITAEYRRADPGDNMRRTLIRFFDPKQTGVLTATYGSISRKIAYEVESFSIGQKNLFEPLRFSVSLICPSPYWQDVNSFTKNMAGIRALTAFPFVIPAGSGRVLSYREMQQEAVVVNPGSKAAGLNVLFIAKRGAVTNPMLINLSTGQYIRLMLTMAEGDRLSVCTVPGSKRVEHNGVNAIQYIDRGSSFFGLAPGETVLKYDAGENKQNLDVYPRFTPEYLGV